MKRGSISEHIKVTLSSCLLSQLVLLSLLQVSFFLGKSTSSTPSWSPHYSSPLLYPVSTIGEVSVDENVSKLEWFYETTPLIKTMTPTSPSPPLWWMAMMTTTLNFVQPKPRRQLAQHVHHGSLDPALECSKHSLV